MFNKSRFIGLGAVLVILAAVFFGWFSLNNGQVGLAQAGKPITVCASGCDFSKIQAAIDAVQTAGSTIQVQAGTYQENVTINNKQDLALQGAGRDVVTLDGSAGVADKKPAILVQNSQKITIKGLQIVKSRRGVEADDTTGLVVADSGFKNNLRQGILLQRAEATLSGNLVQDTQPDQDGTLGIGTQMVDSQVILKDSTLTDNGNTGIVISKTSTATINGNTISRNRESGVWVQDSAQATITNNRISENRPGPLNNGIGIAVFGSGQATIQKNTIMDNNDAGVHFGENSRGTIEDNEITGNRSCGVSLRQFAEVTIINNRINRNRPDAQGRFGRGIRIQDDARATIRDNQIIGNAHYGVVVFLRSQATLVNNTISENVSGGLGIGADDTQGETVKVEASNNTIQNNRQCGVYADYDPGIKITGQSNTISGNARGNLCGDTNKLPPGFGGGK